MPKQPNVEIIVGDNFVSYSGILLKKDKNKLIFIFRRPSPITVIIFHSLLILSRSEFLDSSSYTLHEIDILTKS